MPVFHKVEIYQNENITPVPFFFIHKFKASDINFNIAYMLLFFYVSIIRRYLDQEFLMKMHPRDLDTTQSKKKWDPLYSAVHLQQRCSI